VTGAADPPRSRRFLRLIALERMARGVLLLAAGVYLLFHLSSDLGRLADHAIRAIELDPRRPFLHRFVAYLHRLHASELRIAALFALIVVNVAIVVYLVYLLRRRVRERERVVPRP
jgi:Predicted membrane protein (DUF2127)